ncbi:MAG: hypothetical protein AAGU11_09675, partial [Syntrophobacteraceae bacterium]
MVGSVRIGKAAVRFSICLVLLFLSACSMQKPANTLDGRASEEQKLAGNTARVQSVQQKDPVRIDYLTPIPEITNPEI